MTTLRKLLSILLLAVFGLAPATPVLALGTATGSRLPACCRRGGVHHCMGSMAAHEQGSVSTPQFRNLPQECPYSMPGLVAPHPSATALPEGQASFALTSRRSLPAMCMGAARRFACQSSHPKRGPPASV